MSTCSATTKRRTGRAGLETRQERKQVYSHQLCPHGGPHLRRPLTPLHSKKGPMASTSLFWFDQHHARALGVAARQKFSSELPPPTVWRGTVLNDGQNRIHSPGKLRWRTNGPHHHTSSHIMRWCTGLLLLICVTMPREISPSEAEHSQGPSSFLASSPTPRGSALRPATDSPPAKRKLRAEEAWEERQMRFFHTTV